MARNLFAILRRAAWARVMLAATLWALAAVGAAGEEVPLRELGSIPTSGVAQDPVILSAGGGVLYLVYAEGPVHGEPGVLRVHRSDDDGETFFPYALGPSAYSLDSVRDLKLFLRIDDDWLLFLVASAADEDRLLAFRLDGAGELVLAYGEALDLLAVQTSRAGATGPEDGRIAFYEPYRHSFGGITVVYQKAGMLLQTTVPNFRTTVLRSEISLPGGQPSAYTGRTMWIDRGDVHVGMYATPGDGGTQAVLFQLRDGLVARRDLLACTSAPELVRGEVFEDLRGAAHLLVYDGAGVRVMRREAAGWTERDAFALPSVDSLVEPFLNGENAIYVVSGSGGLVVRKRAADGQVEAETLSTEPARSDRAWRVVSDRECVNHHSSSGGQLYLAMDLGAGTWRLYPDAPASLSDAQFSRFFWQSRSRVGALSLVQGVHGSELVALSVGRQGFQELFRLAPDLALGEGLLGAELVSASWAVVGKYLLESAQHWLFLDGVGNTSQAAKSANLRVLSSGGRGIYAFHVDGSALRILSFVTEGAEA